MRTKSGLYRRQLRGTRQFDDDHISAYPCAVTVDEARPVPLHVGQPLQAGSAEGGDLRAVCEGCLGSYQIARIPQARSSIGSAVLSGLPQDRGTLDFRPASEDPSISHTEHPSRSIPDAAGTWNTETG